MTLFVLIAAACFYGFSWFLMLIAGVVHLELIHSYPNVSYAESAVATVSLSFLISLYHAFKHDTEAFVIFDSKQERYRYPPK